MKIKSLILALPVFCLACSSSSSDPGDPAYQMEASPTLAKEVAGVWALTTDANYDEPCNILGEEYVRNTFKLGEDTELTEGHHQGGCDFSWAGNKVDVAFGGTKPYSSVYVAERMFDNLYQAKPVAVVSEPVEETDSTAKSGPEPEGTSAELPTTEAESAVPDDDHPKHSGVTAAIPPLTKPAVNKGNFAAVPNVGDKAVWDATTGAMHVLYNNHIINVTVETKDKPEVKKERAQSLTEVLIDKIAADEYIRRL